MLTVLLCVTTAAVADNSDSGTNAPAEKPRQTFEVKRYDVRGNTILSSNQLEGVLSKHTGQAITLDDVRKALGDLQLAYRERGYVTVGISLPPQKLTNATLLVDVAEGKLVNIRIKGNRYFSSNNVMRALPVLHTNQFLNSHVFQRELDQSNANRDRQVYPQIEPGPVPGTSSLLLNVKDRLPLHGRAEVDNYSTPGTPDLRLNFSVEYDNFWQLEHQLGLSYGFSPERYKPAGLMTDYLLDEPQINYSGAYYRIPFGTKPVEDQIANNRRFGYNEATHQFVLPPSDAGGDLTFYGSASASDTGVEYGAPNVVFSNSLAAFTTSTSGRNLSVNENVGARFTYPLLTGEHYRLTVFGGIDYKQYSLSIYGTNTGVISFFYDASSGTAQPPPVQSSVPNNSPRAYVHYFPVNAGMSLSESDRGGDTAVSFSATFNTSGGTDSFARLAYSQNARETYAKFNLSLSRQEKLWKDFSLLARCNAQAASVPLLGNEQFALGGNNSIRGYYEGEDYGDSGWSGSLEIRTPYVERRVASLTDFVPAWLRASVFADYGQRYLLDAAQGQSSERSLLGAGLALLANINNHVDAKVTVAWPLLKTANTPGGATQVIFSLGGQF